MALADTANLVVRLSLDDKFSGPLRNASSQLSRLEGSGRQIGRGMVQVAGGLDRIATRAAVGAAAGLGLVVKTAIDFEDAWAGVEKTVNETDLTKIGSSFEKLQEQFRAMAREIPVSFEELSAIGEQAGALGIAAGDITNFTKVVAELGVTTDLSSEQAATALGQLGTVLHLRGNDFNEFADSLVNLGNQGASTESQIIQIATRFAAAGRQAGLSKEEILGFSSATASMGVQVEAAGSALSRIFNSVTTNIGVGSDKAKAFAKVIGLPFQEFKKQWDQNAAGVFQDFLVNLSKLDKFKQASVLKSIGITNVRDINAIQLMAQNTKELSRQLDVAKQSAGALNKEAEKRFATTKSQIQRFQNVLRDTGFVIGKELLPVINDALSDLTNELAKPENQKRIADFAKNLAQGARDLVAAVKRGDFNTLIDTMKGAAAVAKTAFDAFNALPGPVKQLALAAIVGNKVTGGGLGLLAKGLGNILAGTLKIAFPKLDIFSRGSPFNPMFVKVIGGLPGGGPTGGIKPPSWLAPVTQAGGLTGLVTLVAGIATPFIMFDLIPKLFPGGTAPKGSLQDPNASRFTLNSRTGPDGTRTKPLNVVVPPGFGQQFTGLMPSFPANADVTTPTPAEIKALDAAFENNRQNERLITEAKGGRLATAHAAVQTSSAIHTLEQRLINDPKFKPQVNTVQDFIKLLRRTSEFGAKGVGTTIEQGPKTGRDPVGDAFVALVSRLKPPLLKANIVQGEIRRHIQALEQVQGRLLKEGNVSEARHAQRNINTLYKLIGSVDRTIPHFRTLEQKAREQVQKANETRVATERGLATAARATENVRTTLANKNFSPSFNANVYTTVNAQLSTYSAVQTITRVDSIRYGGKALPVV